MLRHAPRGIATDRRGTALVRRPGPLLADGIVTHIAPTPVDVYLAVRQHAAYVQALAASGWVVPDVHDDPGGPQPIEDRQLTEVTARHLVAHLGQRER